MTRGFRFDRFSGIYLGALFIVVFTVWKPQSFATMGTVHSVAAEQAIGAMLALAVLVPLAAGAYDLSVGATINFSTVLVAVLQSNRHWSMWPAILITLVSCAAIGVVVGFVVVKLRVNSFIATLGAAAIVAALQSVIAGQTQPLPPTSTSWTNLTQTVVGGFQVVFIYLIILAVVVWWMMACTPVGRYLYALGGNSEAARLSGVNVGRWTWFSLVCSSLIAGVAGVFYASLSGPSLDFGPGLLLPAFAAVFLGSTQLQPGKFNVWGTMIAVYVLAIGVKGLQLVTSVQWLSDMFNGVALIAAVAFAVWRQRKGQGTLRVPAERTPARNAKAAISSGQDPGDMNWEPIEDETTTTSPKATDGPLPISVRGTK